MLVGFYDAATAAQYFDPTKYLSRQLTRPAGTAQVSVTAEVPAGSWTIAVYHNLKGNGKLDTNLVGQHFAKGAVPVTAPDCTLCLTMVQP